MTGLRISRVVAIATFFLLVAFPLARIINRLDYEAPPAELLAITLFSIKQAGLSLFGSLLLGVGFGFFYAEAWSRNLRGLLFAAFSMPSLLVIGTISSLLRGTEIRFGLAAVVIAHVFLNAPWIALATAEGIRSLPQEWRDAARTLGATRARVFFRIELPWIARGIALASAQVFALCLMSFAIVMILGGGPPVATLETEIYAAVRGGGLALSKAAWFAGTLLFVAGGPLLVVAALRDRAGVRDSVERKPIVREPSPWKRGSAVVIASAWVFLPLILFGREFSLEKIAILARDAEFQSSALVSLRIGVWTVCVSLLIGAIFALGARTSRLVRGLAALPIGLSPLMISLGFFLAYSEWIDPFSGSETGMVLVQAALFLPFSLRFFLPLLADTAEGSERSNLRAVARSLGATPFTAWKKLEWPRWRSAAVRLAGLLFVWSFSELAAASFFGSERLTTLGVLLVGWMARYRFDDVSAILFMISILSSSILFAVGRSEDA